MGDRVLAIGLDGGTFSVLEPLASRGVMPTLASLMEHGRWGTLRSTVPPVTAPAWTSFITGKNPGKHGIYQFFSLDPLSADSLGMGQRSYLAIPGIVVNSTRIPGPKLWSLIDRAGLRQVLMNIPMTYPPEPVNGLMVTGMLTPPGSSRFTHPPELAGEMSGYEIDLDPREKDFSGDDGVFLRRVAEILDKRRDWALRLMKERPWDFFMVVFTETDRLQHRFFDLVDPAPAADLSPARSALIPLVEDLYRRVDTAMAELIEAAGRRAHLVLLSDHGFGAAPRQLVDLRVLSGEVGLAPGSPAADAPRRRWPGRLRPTKHRIYKYLGFLPERWLKSAEARYRRRRLRNQPAILFKMHENVGAVWINRHPGRGGASTPKERRALAADLAERLGRVTWRGAPVVRETVLRDRLYHGPLVESAPDLVFTLGEEFGILEPDLAPPSGDLVVPAPADRPRKKGTHRMEGMFLVGGPQAAAGEDPEGAAIEDVTATILHLLGLAVPDDLDGRVIERALTESFRAGRPVRVEAAAGTAAAGSAAAYDAAEEAAVRDRLEGIGYLD